MTPRQTLNIGNAYPYDASDHWNENIGNGKPHTQHQNDPAYRAARGVLCDLQDRRGIKHGFDDLDEDVRETIVSSLAAIIREAYKK